MVEHTATPRLHDIVQAIERIRAETEGVTLEAFEADWRRRWMVERGIEIFQRPAATCPPI